MLQLLCETKNTNDRISFVARKLLHNLKIREDLGQEGSDRETIPKQTGRQGSWVNLCGKPQSSCGKSSAVLWKRCEIYGEILGER
ncbi:MAG TPA: hypothetical protein DDW76_05475 [Cyanobacteria bacterium UBA11369]|nr:hypothetical protein [Cyanobacteria bacterium UBA11371]HBE34840.1 hypothetical protein [Cyanobacteria bacterium UBA11368]HBE48257.1 hypothetical protein [Cyanobacteria bacterium UBA11369]